MKNIPAITVSCIRDLPLQELQAQSIYNYLDKDCPVYIIVNEIDPAPWFEKFDSSIRKYYKDHNLTIFTLDDFSGDWGQWHTYPRHPWIAGWEKQQILKLLVATKLKDRSYLVLDSQNFLIRSWSPISLYTKGDRIPTRTGEYVMPERTWVEYSKALGINIKLPNDNTMSICTPIFLATKPIKKLVKTQGDSKSFVDWFKSIAVTKSEFVLYLLWLKKNNEYEKYHFTIDMIKDWGHPYLRDCNKNEDFEHFMKWLGQHEYHCWASINFRAWGNMTDSQYKNLISQLQSYNLDPNFDEFRSWFQETKLK